jgi:DNA-binding LacI/PurR family transcriptional regulator
LRGFEQAMAAAGLDSSLRANGDFTTVGGRKAAASLLADFPDLDGLFVANDLMAVGAIRELQSAGRRVPEDVKVVGFDNFSAALESSPPLTTMTNPASELARIATEMLIALLAGERPDSPVMLASELVLRGSA